MCELMKDLVLSIKKSKHSRERVHKNMLKFDPYRQLYQQHIESRMFPPNDNNMQITAFMDGGPQSWVCTR